MIQYFGLEVNPGTTGEILPDMIGNDIFGDRGRFPVASVDGSNDDTGRIPAANADGPNQKRKQDKNHRRG